MYGLLRYYIIYQMDVQIFISDVRCCRSMGLDTSAHMKALTVISTNRPDRTGVRLHAKYTTCLYHMDVHRTAGDTDPGDEICLLCLCAMCFLNCYKGFHRCLVHLLNLVRVSVDIASYPVVNGHDS